MTAYAFYDNEITVLKSIFESMANGQSKLDTDALTAVFNNACITTTEQEIATRLAEANFPAPLSFEDFLRLLGRQREKDPEQGLARVFAILDEDKNGQIDGDDLRRGLLGFGETVTDEEIQCMMNTADIDGDGMINFEEFVKILTPSRVNGRL